MIAMLLNTMPQDALGFSVPHIQGLLKKGGKIE